MLHLDEELEKLIVEVRPPKAAAEPVSRGRTLRRRLYLKVYDATHLGHSALKSVWAFLPLWESRQG